jgi:hypothetical protein
MSSNFIAAIYKCVAQQVTQAHDIQFPVGSGHNAQDADLKALLQSLFDTIVQLVPPGTLNFNDYSWSNLVSQLNAQLKANGYRLQFNVYGLKVQVWHELQKMETPTTFRSDISALTTGPPYVPSHDQKFGGQGNVNKNNSLSTMQKKNAGANPTVTKYLPTQGTYPYVESKKEVRPCFYANQPGSIHRQIICKRTNIPGVNDCHYQEIQDNRPSFQPMNCKKETIKLLKGVNVSRTEGMFPDGTPYAQDVETPIYQSYPTITSSTPVGKPIPYKSLTSTTPALTIREGPELVNTYPSGADNYGQLMGRDAGSAGNAKGKTTTKKTAGARSSILLPTPAEVAKANFTLTDQDIQQYELPVGFMEEPKQWASLPPPMPGTFYDFDSGAFGLANLKKKEAGFPFPEVYLPYEEMQNKTYLSWLITVSISMRMEYADRGFEFLYDPITDTQETIASAILTWFGKMEAAGEYFDRKLIFGGEKENLPDAASRKLMNENLKYYVYEPKKEIWVSELSNRYTVVPAVEQSDGERNAREALFAFTNVVQQKITDEKLDLELNRAFRYYSGTSFAELEDALISLLARLQSKGFAVQTGHPAIVTYSQALLRVGNREFLSQLLVAYIDLYMESNPQEFWYYLPLLRRRMAEEHNITLPGPPVQLLKQLEGRGIKSKKQE